MTLFRYCDREKSIFINNVRMESQYSRKIFTITTTSITVFFLFKLKINLQLCKCYIKTCFLEVLIR